MKNILIVLILIITISMAVFLMFFRGSDTGTSPAIVDTGVTNSSTDGDRRQTLSVQQRESAVTQQFAEIQNMIDYSGDWSTHSFSDVDGLIPLDLGLQALNANVPPNLHSYLDQTSWSVERCFIGGQVRPEYAIRMEVQLLPGYEGNLYSDLISQLRLWEPLMLDDLASILFPDEVRRGGVPTYIDSFKALDPQYQDGTRWAQVALPVSGGYGEIAYTIQDDYVIVGSGSVCVDVIAWDLFGPG